MPQFTPMPTLVVGDILTTTRWGYLRDNLNKLLNTGHRSLTVAQFGALTGLEGTAGTVAGDEVYLIVDATKGILWHLVYESTETTYKWRFLGGPALVVSVSNFSNTTGASTWVYTSAGLTAPRGGDYEFTLQTALGNASGVASAGFLSLGVAGVNVSAIPGNEHWTIPIGGEANLSYVQHAIGIAASAAMQIAHLSTQQPMNFTGTALSVKPARLV